MTHTDTNTARLYNTRIIGKSRTVKATMIATSQFEAEQRLTKLAGHLFHGGNGGHRRVEAIEAHGPVPASL